MSKITNLSTWFDCEELNNEAVLHCMKVALPIIIENELTDVQKHYVMLRYGKNMLYADIASTLGVNVSTVSHTLKRVHRRIQKALEYVKLGAEQYGIEEDY